METGGGEPPKRLAKMKKRCFLSPADYNNMMSIISLWIPDLSQKLKVPEESHKYSLRSSWRDRSELHSFATLWPEKRFEKRKQISSRMLIVMFNILFKKTSPRFCNFLGGLCWNLSKCCVGRRLSEFHRLSKKCYQLLIIWRNTRKIFQLGLS